MKEYIEREVALNSIEEIMNIVCEQGNPRIGKAIRTGTCLGIAFCRNEVLHAPAADVVEVVRCKDCKYCIPAIADNAEYELCIVDNDVFPVSVQKQHFCGRGKRKEE